MAHVMAFKPRPRPTVVPDDSARLAAQTDLLIDAIAGSARCELEGLPVAVIFAKLCNQLRAMGLEPAEAKVLKIAAWIAGPTNETPGAHAA